MSNYEFTDDGFVDDGYIFTGRPVIFQSGANRVELRGPSKRSGRIRLLQAEEYSSGWARYGYAPLAIVHTLTLEYQQLRSDEVDQLKAFQTAVDYSAGTFSFIDGASGLTVPAWFAEPNQAIEEISYNKYGATIELHSLTPFFTLPAAPANIDAILNAAHYPCSVRITRKQPQVWMSDGTRRIANKSAITRQLHTLALVRLTADQLGALCAHFIGMGGMKNRWTWTASPALLIEEGSTNICRYSEMFDMWTKASAGTGLLPVITPDNIVAPDGTQTADKLVLDRGGANISANSSTLYITVGAPTIPGSVYTLSFWILGAAGIDLLVRHVAGATYTRILCTGGWQKITFGETAFSTTGGVFISNRGGFGLTSQVSTIWVWGMQLEQKAYATSYIPTTSAAVTRPASYTPAVTHTCRHAHTALDWQQSPLRSDRYDLTVSLEEDL